MHRWAVCRTRQGCPEPQAQGKGRKTGHKTHMSFLTQQTQNWHISGLATHPRLPQPPHSQRQKRRPREMPTLEGEAGEENIQHPPRRFSPWAAWWWSGGRWEQKAERREKSHTRGNRSRGTDSSSSSSSTPRKAEERQTDKGAISAHSSGFLSSETRAPLPSPPTVHPELPICMDVSFLQKEGQQEGEAPQGLIGQDSRLKTLQAQTPV